LAPFFKIQQVLLIAATHEPTSSAEIVGCHKRPPRVSIVYVGLCLA